MLKSRWITSAGLLVALVWGSTAQAQQLLSLTSNSGGQLQIGTGLPLPIGIQGIFLGGMTPGDAANFPPLLIPPAPLAFNKTIVGTVGGALQIPAAVLSRPAPGVPVPIAVFPTNPAVFQVATTIDYGWPSAAATLAPGGGPGSTILGTPGGGEAIYNAGPQAFGGAAQFSIVAGSGSGTARLAPNALGVLPIASVWINFAGRAPASAMAVAVVGASAPAGVAQVGAPVAAPAGTTMFGRPSNGFGAVNVTTMGTAMNLVCCAVLPAGTIMSSVYPIFPLGTAVPGLSNMVTASKGFPWTTGTITLSADGVLPAEVFFLKGADMRIGGEGNIQLVSGALSLRALSGPNANRGWLSLTLPEPSAAMGAMGALVALGVCHASVRRRLR